jgi:tetratricopeptide (TPR) repeat protein
MKKPKQTEKKQAPVQKPASKWWQKNYFFEGLIFAFTFLLFANSISNSYNMDDELVTINQRLTSKGISAIPEIFTSPYYQDESGYSYEYRPVVLTSFAIEHQIFGDNPHVSHFWNVLLYALFCVLLYRLLLLLFKDYSPLFALAITLLFAVHPSHTEVVCSIKNRDEILGLGFSLLACLYAIRSIREKKIWMLVLVPVFFVLSLLSKLTFLSFAFIIPLALILFEEFDLWRLLFIVPSLLIPALLISDLGNTTAKILIVVAAVLGVLVLYSFKDFAKVRQIISQLAASILNKDKYSLQEEESPKGESSSFIQDILAPFSALTLRDIGLFAILTSLFVFGLYYNFYLIQILVSIVLAVLLFEKNENRKWLTYLTIYILIIVRTYYLGLYKQAYFLDFFTLPIAFNLLYGKRSFFIPSLIAFISSIVLFAIKPHTDGAFIMPFTIAANLFLQRFRFGWLVIIISFLTPIISGLSPFDLHDFTINLLYNIAAVILLLSVFLKKFPSTTAKAFLVVALGVCLFLNSNGRRDSTLITQSVYKVTAIDSKDQSKKQNRPVQYVENCTDFVKTPQNIKAGTSFEILFHYLCKTAVPYPLSFYYGYSFIKPMKIMDSIPLISLILHLLLFVTAIFAYRRNRIISFGILLYLISISLFANYFQPVAGMLADRFLLVPTLGWAILLVALLQIIFKVNLPVKEFSLKSVPAGAKYIFAVILVLYSSLSFSRNFNWKDYLTLFEHDISYVESSSQAHNLLALRLMKLSYDDNSLSPADQLAYRKKASIHFRRAVEIYPLFFNANYDLGRTYQILGNADSAVFFYKKALELNPDFTTASLAVGEILMQQAKVKEAEYYYQQVIKGFPKDYTGYDKLSYAYFVEKEYDKSIDVLKKAHEEIPQNNQPCLNLARVYHTVNHDDSARIWIQKALELNPNDPQVQAFSKTIGGN